MKTHQAIISKTDGLLIRKSGPWIRKKHFYLTRYIDIFTKGMKKKWDLTYVDLFAGPGRCLIEATNEEEDGSPLIALAHDFSRYIFVEQTFDGSEALRQRCERSPKFDAVQIIDGDCNEVIEKINIPSNSLALAFIDPTGIDVHFNTIKKLTANRRMDLLINIQFGMDIKRNFARYKKQGDDSDLGLFLGGNVDWNHLKTPRDAIALYRNRIKQLGYSTVEFKDVTVHNVQRNVPMYFLFFAAKHPRGLDFWKKITERDNLGQYELL